MPSIIKPDHYICYYGPGRLANLQKADWVILQADHYTPADLYELNTHNTLTFAYLSIGEEPLGTLKSWHIRTPDLARQTIINTTWATAYIDCRSSEWQAYLLEKIVPQFVQQGFRGLMLDTLDVQEQFPQTRPGVIHLLQQLHHSFPDMHLIANRGFSLIDEISPLVSAFLFESYSTYHTQQLCAAWPEQDHAWLDLQAQRLQAAGKPVLALDYANPDQPALAKLALDRAQSAGFIPYVTNWALDWLSPWPLDTGNPSLNKGR